MAGEQWKRIEEIATDLAKKAEASLLHSLHVDVYLNGECPVEDCPVCTENIANEIDKCAICEMSASQLHAQLHDASVVIEALRAFLNERDKIAGDPIGFLQRQLECYDAICVQYEQANTGDDVDDGSEERRIQPAN